MLVDCLRLLGGLIVLVGSADLFIRGAVRVARWLGVSPFMIGLTLVGFGTSAPELIVGISSAVQGTPNLSVGNVVGSNIANIGLILGIAAIARPLDARMKLLKVEIPAMITAMMAAFIFGYDGRYDRDEAAILLLGFVMMMVFLYWSGRQEAPETKAEIGQITQDYTTRPSRAILFVILGFAGLALGADLIVDGAVGLARRWGMTEAMIGMTILAIGTTLPELAASVTAARRGESDVALGNIIGSVLFNILLILGTVAMIHPIDLTATPIRIELGVMVGFGLLLLPILLNGLKVHRYEGVFLVTLYLGFLTWQVLRSV
ncbi:calcium/sodium antiporter [soil metagenome]